jgi:ribosomal protein L12E/L44/L45/RPP1/RPP2
VIATGFDESVIRADDGLFTSSAPAKPVMPKPAASAAEPETEEKSFPAAETAPAEKEEPAEEDPFESIFRIFNKK